MIDTLEGDVYCRDEDRYPRQALQVTKSWGVDLNSSFTEWGASFVF